MTLPELAIQRPVSTLMALVSLGVLGVVAMTRLPLASKPDMDQPELFVRFPYPGASPEQVEAMIVRPAEDALGSVKGLKEMYSRCDEDGGTIRLELDWAADIHVARVEVWEKIERIRADLPEDLEDISVGEHWNNRESDEPIIELRLSSDIDLSESYDVLDRRIVKPLQRVPGVAQVRLDGVNPREVHVNLRLADLEHHRIDVRNVTRILRASNFDLSCGRIRDERQRFTVRVLGAFRTVEDVSQLVLRPDGLRLRDVADVTYEEPKLDFGRRLDGSFAVGITVSAESKANVVAVCDALEARIAQMDRDPELKGVRFLVRMSQGHEIKATLLELLRSGIIGAALASVVLFLFLRRISSTVVSVLCIPFSIVVTCGLIWLQGSTLNTMSLLGLIVGVGMLVDNAVVVIESIFRQQELGRDRRASVRVGSREVSAAVVAATLTSVIVFLPVIFDKRNALNIQLREIGVTVCLTLLASLFVSQTLIPLAASSVIHARPRPKDRWLLWLEDVYGRLLSFNLRHRWITPVVGLALTASALYPFQRTEVNFDSGEASLYAQVHYHFTEDTPLERKEELVKLVEERIQPHRKELWAKSVYSWWSDGFSMTRIYLEDGLADEEHIAQVHARLRELVPEAPGVRIDVGDRGRSWRRDRGKRISVQLLGPDSAVLGALAEEVRARLEPVQGLVSVQASADTGRRELRVELDRDLAVRHAVTPDQIAETVGLTFRGRRLARFRTPDGEREMRLTLEERQKESLSQLQNLPLWSVQNGKIPLASVAQFRQTPAPERIERTNRLKSVWVWATYRDGTREELLPGVQAALEEVRLPRGYSWSFGDREARQRERSREFVTNLVLALLLVFAVMAGVFESIERAIALMIALPFALSGAIWTLYLAGADFDQPAAVGLLLLVGIVVNNGIVLIEHINGYQRAGMTRLKAMLKGGRERLRPILMTALTTLIGLLPVVIERPSLGDMRYDSMALVIMGGLSISTFLTMLLLPTTAVLIEDFVVGAGKLARRVGRVAGGSYPGATNVSRGN